MPEIPVAIAKEIALTELRIRNWILAGLLVNIVGWIPVIFFIGSMYSDIRTMAATAVGVDVRVENQEDWMRDQGYRPRGESKHMERH